MKTLSIVLALFALAGFALVGCSDNSVPVVAPGDRARLLKAQAPPAKSTVTNFTATGIPMSGPFTDPDGKGKINGAEVESHVDATDQRVTGVMHIVYDAAGPHTEHGKFTLVPDTGGGMWEGSWQGRTTSSNPPIGRSVWRLEWQMGATGRGGTIDGMHLSITATSINGRFLHAGGSITSR